MKERILFAIDRAYDVAFEQIEENQKDTDTVEYYLSTYHYLYSFISDMYGTANNDDMNECLRHLNVMQARLIEEAKLCIERPAI